MSLTQLDGATFPSSQLKDRVDSDLWGFDGTVWRPVSVDASGAINVVGGGGGGGGAITGNTQVQSIETTAALGASATFTGTEFNNINYEAMGISVYLMGGGVDTTVTVTFQQSQAAAGTKRPADSVILNVAAGANVYFDRIWHITRQYGQVTLTNNTANALAATEVIAMRKAIS